MDETHRNRRGCYSTTLENGRELSSNEMKQTRVAHLLKKIHNSRPLLSMLKRMEMEPITPEIMLNKINASLSREVLTHHIVRKIINLFRRAYTEFRFAFFHCCTW